MSGAHPHRIRLDDGTTNTARDSAGTENVTLTSGATWSSGRGGAVALNGSTGCLATTSAVLDTTGSFTVSAWVKLNATNAFALQYTGSADNKWAFTLPTTNATARPPSGCSPATRCGPVWTHLIATYDASGKLAQLYVDARWQNSATHSTPWASEGMLTIGRGKANGGLTASLNGLVSDVRAYQVAVNEYDATSSTPAARYPVGTRRRSGR
jgi:hypothetical protein